MKHLVKVWRKLPVLLRAVIGGLVVQIIGYIPLVLFFQLNLKYGQGVPWALAPLSILFWGYWSFFGGRGWPVGTQEVRRKYRRSNPLPSGSRLWVGLASGFFGLTMMLTVILQHASIEIPEEALSMIAQLGQLPWWTSVPLAVALSVFVGVQEEMAFRGYMQTPIEAEHGPLLALTVPALFFTLAHGLDPVMMPVFFAVSLGWSFLSWVTGSIRPGIVVHTSVDLLFILWGLASIKDLKPVLAYSILEQGMTPGLGWLAVAAASSMLVTMILFFLLWRSVKETLNTPLGDEPG